MSKTSVDEFQFSRMFWVVSLGLFKKVSPKFLHIDRISGQVPLVWSYQEPLLFGYFAMLPKTIEDLSNDVTE